jgi:hypothetical protein
MGDYSTLDIVAWMTARGHYLGHITALMEYFGDADSFCAKQFERRAKS